jgi:hypothetical protein
MPDTAVQEEVGRQLPNGEMENHLSRDEGEPPVENPWDAGLSQQITEHEDRGITNQQPFYALREIACGKEGV